MVTAVCWRLPPRRTGSWSVAWWPWCAPRRKRPRSEGAWQPDVQSDLRARHAEIPRSEIRSVRHRVVHRYLELDVHVAPGVIEEDLAPLQAVVEHELDVRFPKTETYVASDGRARWAKIGYGAGGGD